MRVVLPLLVAFGLAATLFSVGVQAAPFADVTFTVIAADDADYPLFGALDPTEIAVGEPGDETVVFRVTVASAADASGAGSIDLFFNVGETAYRPGFNEDGSVAGVFDSCVLDGNAYFCVMTYEALGASVGSVIASPHGISYLGVAQDVIPGLLYPLEFAAGAGALPVGTDYTLVGSTSSGGSTPPPSEGPQTFYKESSGASLKETASAETASSDTYVYNWTTTVGSNEVKIDATVDAGTVGYTVKDGAGKTLASGAFTETDDFSQAFDKAAAGTWQVTLSFADFAGSVNVDIHQIKTIGGTPTGTTPTKPTGTGATPTGATPTSGTLTPDNTTTTPTKKKESPGAPALVLVAGILAVALVEMRRRNQ